MMRGPLSCVLATTAHGPGGSAAIRTALTPSFGQRGAGGSTTRPMLASIELNPTVASLSPPSEPRLTCGYFAQPILV